MGKMATREAYGKALAQLALENENIVAVAADLAGSCKTSELQKVAPERHFDVGIAEANMIGVGAGLAANGKIPFCSTFAMFATSRCYDQIRNTVAYSELNVKICASHAGLTVGEDGATHQAIEDIALMRALPGMIVVQPCDGRETTEAVKAIAAIDGPCYLRMSRFAFEDVNTNDDYKFELGKGIVLHEGSSPITMVATGCLVQESLKAIEILKQQGIDPTLINIHTIKPLDEDLIVEYAGKSDLIVSLEEHSVIGGLGSAVADCLARKCPTKQIFIGVQDVFGESGKPMQLLDKFGMSSEKIVERILEEVQ